MRRRGVRIVAVMVLLGGLAVGWGVWRGTVAAQPRCAAVRAALGRVVPLVRVKDEPLETFLRDLEQLAGVPIDVDWDSLAAQNVPRDKRVSIHCYDATVRTVLDRLCAELARDGSAIYAEGAEDRIVVCSWSTIDQHVVAGVYDVSDVLNDATLDRINDPATFNQRAKVAKDLRRGSFTSRRDPVDAAARRREKFLSLAKESVGAHSWNENGGALGDIRLAGDHLFVVHTPVAHAEVAEYLRALRGPVERRADWPGPWANDEALRALLARRAPGDVTFEAVPFDDALDVVRETFRANITIDPQLHRAAARATNLTLDLHSPTLEELLTAMLEKPAVGLDRQERRPVRFELLRDNELRVEALPRYSVLRHALVYDLTSVLPARATDADVENFMQQMRIETAAAPDGWRHVGYTQDAKLIYWRAQTPTGRVLLDQPRETHRAIRQWLDERRPERETAR